MEDKYKTFWSRVLALILDSLVLWLASIVFQFVYAIAGTQPLTAFEALIPYVYTIGLHGAYGQTLGKYVAKVKVVTPVGGSISFGNAFLRDLVPIVLTLIATAFFYVYFPDLSQFLNDGQLGEEQIEEVIEVLTPMFIPSLAISLASLTWLLLDLGVMLTNHKRRALHDLIGGTVVVRPELS